MRGSIGSLVVYKNMMYEERPWSRTETLRCFAPRLICVSGNKFGARIAREHPWGPARSLVALDWKKCMWISIAVPLRS